MATELQHAIAKLCGLDLGDLSKRSAAARLRVALAEELLAVYPERPTTERQVEIAHQLEIANLSIWREIAGLQIEAEFVRLNELAMEQYSFSPGMRVRFVGGPSVHGFSHELGAEYIISKVKPDGRVYLRQTNGASAYANQLEAVA